MAYVITDNCIKDALCVDVCPTDCIHRRKTSPNSRPPRRCLLILPDALTAALAFQPASDSIYTQEDLPDDRSSSQKPTPLISPENASLS